MDRTALKRRGVFLVLLAAITLTTFWPVLRNDFIKFDDGQYITDNPRVFNGLTWANIAWACRSGYASNWHPLTWLSHMLDVQLFGLHPLGHHLTSLLLHTANSLLLFLLLNRMTGALWRSFFVAGLFAVHPLHVESVAWVAERKDVLSTFFFMLTLLAYVRYVNEATERGQEQGRDSITQGPKRDSSAFCLRPTFFYFLGLSWFALGLMSKPMLVTTPFVLLLLDYWPLQRFRPGPAGLRSSNAAALLVEKVPFLVLSMLSSGLTFVAQEKSQSLMAGLPLILRVENAVTSYLKYLVKTIWPTNLAVFYPHPNLRFFSRGNQALYPPSEQWPLWQIGAAALLLFSVSYLFILRRRHQPWLMIGWFWFLGTLVPVIGIIQVGTQALADRYTYIPLIGIFFACVWSAGAVVSGDRFRKEFMVSIGTLVLGACAVLTHKQIGYWHDNLTVFTHALAMSVPNPVAEFNLGTGFLERKQDGLAQAHLRHALIADPNYGEAYAALGYLFESQWRPELALEAFQKAVRLRPWDDLSRCHIASILEKLGRINEAIALYREALRLNPDNVRAHYYLGAALCDRGDLAAGADQCAAALRLQPDYTDALICLADATARQGKLVEAEAALRHLVRLHPATAELRINLGGLLWRQGHPKEALEQYATAIRLNPQEPVACYDAGTILAAQGERAAAVARFTEAIRLKPDYLEARVALGRLLSDEGDFQAAATTLQAAVQFFPNNGMLYLELGKVLNLAKDTNAAAICFSNALRLDRSLAEKAKTTTTGPP